MTTGATLMPKAKEELVAGLVHVEAVTEGHLRARVQDRDFIATVTRTGDEWSCDCKYWGGPSVCCHAAAVMHVTAPLP